jgi:hypothetical protein
LIPHCRRIRLGNSPFRPDLSRASPAEKRKSTNDSPPNSQPPPSQPLPQQYFASAERPPAPLCQLPVQSPESINCLRQRQLLVFFHSAQPISTHQNHHINSHLPGIPHNKQLERPPHVLLAHPPQPISQSVFGQFKIIFTPPLHPQLDFDLEIG